MIVNNRIPELIKKLEQVRSQKRSEAMITRLGGAIGDRVLVNLRKNQPVGQVEPDYQTRKGKTISHGRPSHRLFGPNSDIGSSWIAPEVQVTGRNGEVVVASNAPHIKWVMDGTKKRDYPIPKAPTGVSFYHIKSNHPVFKAQITHPGTKGNPFVEKSIEDARPQNIETLAKEMDKLFSPVRRFFD